jgi:hypothetical protein
LQPGGLAVHGEDLHGGRRREELEVFGHAFPQQRELLIRVLVHEHDLVTRVVQVLNVLRLGVHALELLARPEGAVDDRAAGQVLQLRTHECPALAGLDVLEPHDPPDVAVDLDVHAVLELVCVDRLCHRPQSSRR